MSAHLQIPVITTSSQPSHNALVERERLQPLSVRTSAAFSVAPNRLLYALTIPEYVETWFTPPDLAEISCAGNPKAGEALSIELRHHHRMTASIFAEYKSTSAQDLNIRWYVRSRANTNISQLRISIRTVRADAILRIRHTGFATISDWQWHQELWGLSLTKMQMLIR